MTAKPGEVVSGYVKVVPTSDGNYMTIPTIIINGKQDGPVLLVEACTHGDEVEAGLAALKLVKSVNPSSLKGTLIVVPVLNTASFEAGQRGNPLERHWYDMNRVFPGKIDGSMTQQLAYAFFNDYVLKANYLISFHGGGAIFYLDPFIIAESENAFELVKGMAWERYTFQADIGIVGGYPGSIERACFDKGIPAIICEHGGGIDRTPERLEQMVDKFVNGALNCMKRLKMLEGEPLRPKITEIKKVNIRARAGGFILYEKNFRIGAQVKKGEHLCSIVDLLGKELQRIEAPYDGYIIILPSYPQTCPGYIVTSVYAPVRTVQT